MAYYFRIHKGIEAQNSSTGWNKTDIIRDDNTGIQSIDDTIDQIPASGKVGTSIPTPLARNIFLIQHLKHSRMSE